MAAFQLFLLLDSPCRLFVFSRGHQCFCTTAGEPICPVVMATKTTQNKLDALEVACEQCHSLPHLPPQLPESCDRSQMLRKGLNLPSRQRQNQFPKGTAALNSREKQPKPPIVEGERITRWTSSHVCV